MTPELSFLWATRDNQIRVGNLHFCPVLTSSGYENPLALCLVRVPHGFYHLHKVVHHAAGMYLDYHFVLVVAILVVVMAQLF